jgi:glutathione peroxidase
LRDIYFISTALLKTNMKKYFYTILGLAFAGILIYSFSETKFKASRFKEIAPATSFHQLSIAGIDGKTTLHMKDYKGKFVLCVNVASECGYTKQYAALQQLSDTYKEKLVIIGFPCNQFMGQEPGTAEEIQQFCKKNYGVKFPLTQKIDVKGSAQHPIYAWLTQKSLNGKEDVNIKWNFNKILIDPNGNWVKYYGSGVDPLSKEITDYLK